MRKLQPDLDKLIEKYNSIMLGKGRVRNLVEALCEVLEGKIQGDIVEFGTFEGKTAVLMTQVSDLMEDSRVVWVFDSFEGLPTKSNHNRGWWRFRPGRLKAKRSVLERNFAAAHVRMPVIVPGWFSQVRSDKIPEHICFAHLDGDFYTSILDSLKLTWPRLAKGARIIIDDYGWEGLPGVLAACTDFFADKEEQVCPLRTHENYGFQGLVIRN